MINKHKYLTEDELKMVSAVLTRYREKDVRDVLMLDLLLATGARVGELLMLRPRDLNQADGSIFFHGLKGSSDREIPVPAELFSRLTSYAEGRPEDVPVFNLSYNRTREIWAHYTPVKKKLHSLRHTFAINLYRKTHDIRLVQKALGHKHIATTMVYQDYIYSMDEMRKALC